MKIYAVQFILVYRKQLKLLKAYSLAGGNEQARGSRNFIETDQDETNKKAQLLQYIINGDYDKVKSLIMEQLRSSSLLPFINNTAISVPVNVICQGMLVYLLLFCQLKLKLDDFRIKLQEQRNY